MAIKAKTSFLQVRIDPDVLAAFHAVAAASSARTASALVRWWVEQAVVGAEKRRVRAAWEATKAEASNRGAPVPAEVHLARVAVPDASRRALEAVGGHPKRGDRGSAKRGRKKRR